MKKESEEPGQLKKIISEVITGTVLSHIKETARNVIHKAQDIAYHTEKKILEFLSAAIILICGVIFIAVGSALLINNKLRLESHWGFLIVGIILIFVAFIGLNYFHKTKYKEV